MKIIGVGHSHGWALKRAAAQVNGDRGPGICFPLVGSKAFPAQLTADQSGEKLPCAEIRGVVPPSEDLVFASVFFGNHHNIVGLLERSRSWTVDWKENPSGPDAKPPTRVVSAAAFEDFLFDRLSPLREVLRSMRTYGRVRKIVHFLPPPPTASNAVFKGDVLSNGKITASWLRLALWESQSRVMRTICEESGAVLIDVPSSTLDADGFLLPEFAEDGVHGTTSFGVVQLLHAVSIVGEGL